MAISKEILNQYLDLQEEIKQVQEKIAKLEKLIDKIEQEGTVKDKVTGGEGGWQHFQIEGVPYPELMTKKTLLNIRKSQLTKLEIKVLETLNDIEQFIASIDDSHIRRIVDLRFVEGLSWQGVACKIGGNTEDSVRKAFERYMGK